MNKVTVIGSCHGGQALAAELASRDFEVTLYDSSEHVDRLGVIASQRGIHCYGEVSGFYPIAKTTMDAKEALQDCHYIFIALPPCQHERTFSNILPFLKDGQKVVTLAANFASLVYKRLLKKIDKNIQLFDMGTSPYVFSANNNGHVVITSIKKYVTVASFPGELLSNELSLLQTFFSSKLCAYPDVLSLGLNSVSGIIYPMITLLSARRLGTEFFYFYKEGVSQERAGILMTLDNERLSIADTLDVQSDSYPKLMAQYYGVQYSNIYDFFTLYDQHNILSSGLSSIKRNYIPNDIIYLLVAWLGLAKIAKVQAPLIANIVKVANLINQTNYCQNSANIDYFGLNNFSCSSIKSFVKNG